MTHSEWLLTVVMDGFPQTDVGKRETYESRLYGMTTTERSLTAQISSGYKFVHRNPRYKSTYCRCSRVCQQVKLHRLTVTSPACTELKLTDTNKQASQPSRAVRIMTGLMT